MNNVWCGSYPDLFFGWSSYQDPIFCQGLVPDIFMGRMKLTKIPDLCCGRVPAQDGLRLHELAGAHRHQHVAAPPVTEIHEE